MTAESALSTKPETTPKKETKWIWLVAATLAMLIVLMLPAPAGLPVAGQRALAVLAFAVILWISEAVTYPVSATLVVALTTLLLGLSPSVDKPGTLMGTKEALNLALSGFSNSAVALVAGALFLAAAMQETGLDKRIALYILSKVGSGTRSILFGAILVAVVLSFFVPSTTARVGAILPIILGMVAAFGLPKNSRFAALLVIASAQAASIWNIGVKTAAAQNMVAIGFMEKAFKSTVTWGQWFLYAAPWAILMSVVLYFVMLKVIPPEMKSIPNGQEMVKKQLEELGPLDGKQWRLMIIAVSLLFLWATENILHPLDSTTATLIAVAVMLTPYIGVFTWKQAEKDIPWGTVILFAVGISLGSVLLKTKAATWLANALFESVGLTTLSVLAIVAVLSAFNILVHLGFASATSLAAVLIPVVIALVQGMDRPDINGPGLVLIQQFVISFGFLLPVNAPQNMLAYGTETFTTKDFIKSGIPLTIVGYLLILLMSVTYWQWVGLL
ncbi:SLC13 family permease [Effusibacillus lacus]|uniref:Membrane protein n=1 Tax=Effusibacillus lacus TaxID=1348429 RepID=A0A292YRC1_9BACL|nr:DASS family sodium-coupled anion symporter [Effusibacillus lacus]TCS75716.1 anion transporter [Effusibacillus lacus]GAX91035.1 membrane protein [Effusibacillus lacus]